MATKETTEAEEYLEAIYRLEKEKGLARTMELVRKLKVVPGSVTNTIEGLERRGLVVHEPYRGVKLTEKGRKLALNILRRHRLVERLLTDVLRVDWSEVHDAACRLEHAIGEDIIKPLEKTLGHPKTCPHGNPIPTKGGKIIEERSSPLAELSLGDGGVVVEITEEKRDVLQYLAAIGLVPGTSVKIEEAPFDGPFTVEVSGRHHALDRKLARRIHVKPSKPRGGTRYAQA